jgi:hypothetical protein
MSLPAIPSYELERITDECEAAGVGAEYRRMVKAGTYPREAAMYALQAAPGSRNTDRAFCQGARHQMDNMDADNRKMLYKMAHKAGVNTAGKFYKGGLGKPTDPAAWVTSSDDVLAVCKARNLNCEGVIKHKAIEKDYVPKNIPLAPDIVHEFEQKYTKADPGLAAKVKKSPKARRELQERIIDTHGNKRKAS